MAQLELFYKWYNNQFKKSDLYQTMLTVSENSKWHRESSVAIHTDMVVDQYVSNLQSKTDLFTSNNLKDLLVCTFHDVGKPKARTEKWSEARGFYYGYGGHELISARLWEDYAVKNWLELTSTFTSLIPRDIYEIGWMIEHHKPWEITKRDKIAILALTVAKVSSHQSYKAITMADNKGRISDDPEKNIQQYTSWFETYDRVVDGANVMAVPTVSDKQLIMLIGASGSGKSSFVNSQVEGEYLTHSMDSLRHLWYDNEDYANAFKMSCADPKFGDKVYKRFKSVLSESARVIVDNTNTSNKARTQYITVAKQKGFKVIGVLFPSDLETLKARQATRGDKSVPHDAVERQYFNTNMPSYGLFDDVLVIASNLPQPV